MSLLSTMLAFALVPLGKRNEEKEKERIAFLEAEVVRLGEEKDAWARAYEAQSQRFDEERQRGVLDREQTRHWRSQADYWQSAYTQLAVPSQHGYERQLQRYEQFARENTVSQQYERFSQQAQQLTAQQLALAQQPQQLGQYQGLGQQQLTQSDLGWLCTCVPDRATALRVRPGEAVRVDNVTLARLDLPPRDTDG